MEVSDVRDDLDEIRSRLKTLPEVKQPPDTILEILGKSGSEGAWHSTLEYFINPENPHGFGTDILDRVLGAISNNPRTNFQYSNLDFDAIAVDSEVSLSEGRPDLIIHSAREWFLCIELKVHAQEGRDQTRRYVADDSIGDSLKSEFPNEGHHYIYIAPRSAGPSGANEFVDISWQDILTAIKPLLHHHRGSYPSRSEAQVDDFIATAERELNMTKDSYWTNTTEKARLLVEHQEAIAEIQNAFRQVVEEMKESWASDFLDDHEPPSWSDDWSCAPSIWGQIYHNDWRLSPDFEPVTDQEESAVTVQFVHFVRDEDLLERGKLKMQLKWPKKLDPSSQLRDVFRDKFQSDRVRNRLDPIMNRNDIGYVNGSKNSFTEKVYEVEPTQFPGSYYKTLSRAFEEHYEMVPIVTDVIEEVVEESQV